MLFGTRSKQPEHFDDSSRNPEEFRVAYGQLERVNRLFRLDDPYTRILSQWLGRERCQRLTFLDVGAGDGWLGQAMETWAKRMGWHWQVTSLDANPVPLALRESRRRVIASALDLPFADSSFDIVIASQMTHHFNSDEEVVTHFREAARVASTAVFITDMRRSLFLYGVLAVTLPLLGIRGKMGADGLLSVRKSWIPEEFRELAKRAGIENAEVKGYYGTRLILAARKRSASGPASGTSAAYRAEAESCSVPAGKSL